MKKHTILISVLLMLTALLFISCPGPVDSGNSDTSNPSSSDTSNPSSSDASNPSSSDASNPSSSDASNPSSSGTSAVNAVAPTISIQPAAPTGTVHTGDDVTLSITASASDSGTLSYQWYKAASSTETGSAITGATGKSYAPDTANAGNNWYYCVVTNTIADNGDGGQKKATVNSSRLELSVVEKNTAPDGFVTIPSGTFKMGDIDSFIREVTLTRSLFMCDHEVTQREYETYCQYGSLSPSKDAGGDGDNYPAYYVSWYDALVYCNKRSMEENLTPCYTINKSTDPADWGSIPTSKNTKWDAAICNWEADGYRLPTEAEWKYAARAGNLTTNKMIWSGTDESVYLSDYAWYTYNSNRTAHEVKTKNPNAWGLYDMSGNVDEWCWDWYFYGISSVSTNPTGPDDGTTRSFRGGNYDVSGGSTSVTSRSYFSPYFQYGNLVGFRVCRTISN